MRGNQGRPTIDLAATVQTDRYKHARRALPWRLCKHRPSGDQASEETLATDTDRLARHSHYGRVEAMDWAEDNETDLHLGPRWQYRARCRVAEIADNLGLHHAIHRKAKTLGVFIIDRRDPYHLAMTALTA